MNEAMVLQCQSKVDRRPRIAHSCSLSWKLINVVFLVLSLSACGRTESEGRPPPPEPAPSLNVCKEVLDGSVDGLPIKVSGFCLDPNSDVRRYGEGTASPLDGVCVELFNGECEIYKSYGLESVKTTQYVSEKSARITVQVVVSRFRSSDGAFGFFTRRILGDGLPSQVTVRPIQVEGRAALGPGVLYLWRGAQVLELSYVSELETPIEIETNSEPILLQFGEAMTRGLVGTKVPDLSVRIIEDFTSAPFSVVVRSDGLLEVGGTGPFALGYAQDTADAGLPPHRLLVAERRDESAAKDLLNLVLRHVSYKKLKETKAYRVRFSPEGRSPETWYFSQTENLLLAVGPLEERTQLPEASTPASRKADAATWEQTALKRLTELRGRAAALLKQQAQTTR